MKGTFKITLAYLKEIGACREGQREFQKAFPDGGEYQEVLDRCADEGRLDLGGWLLDHVGPTDEVRICDAAIDNPAKGIIFAGKIEFKLDVNAKFICAGEGIEAGDGFGIFAGLHVRISQWEQYAIVTAKTKPNNLISGYWKPLEAADEKTA